MITEIQAKYGPSLPRKGKNGDYFVTSQDDLVYAWDKQWIQVRDLQVCDIYEHYPKKGQCVLSVEQ
jgi:hypothetical protein